jgi:glutamine cyclotransferase
VTTLPSPPPPEASETAPATIPVYGYRVINVYPHDPGAFTQGLVYEDGFLYEGTGMWGQSSIRRVDLETGQVLHIQPLDTQYFGEGIAIWADHIVQLTWQKNTGFVYDKATFAQLDTFQYPTEGWGITHDGSKLIMSDGTARLHFWDPDTFGEIGYVDVAAAGLPVTRLNELEYIDGLVYANVWQTDRIAIIDPATGAVTAWIDLTGLLPPEDRTPTTDVLNGIAYDAAGGRLFVTGKYWPKLFEIELIGPHAVFLPLIQIQFRAHAAQGINPKPDSTCLEGRADLPAFRHRD